MSEGTANRDSSASGGRDSLGSGGPDTSARSAGNPGASILARRLAAARELLDVAGDRLDDQLRARIAEVAERSIGRLAVAGDHTVVVLAGPTGVGKSSLFNAILDADIATPGVTRPTTSEPIAAVVSSDPVGGLMAHLGLGSWTNVSVSTHPDLESLVLVDLPDHDSVVNANRERAAEQVAVADRLVWVVDPEKYADASVHEDLLAPLREHAGVLTVVLNRVDRLTAQQRDQVVGDLRRLLADEGFGSVEVLSASAVTGEGIDKIRRVLTATITEHRAAHERISADLRAVAAAADPHVPVASDDVDPVDGELVDAAMTAAGVPQVIDAVDAAHRHRARRATGWPLLRRLQASGRDPLARLGLSRTRERGGVGTRSSRSLPHGVASATIATTLRETLADVTSAWPARWADPVDDRFDGVVADLPARLDRAVAGADLDDDHQPGWWRMLGALQWLVTAVALVGGGWLLAAFGVDWLRLPSLPMYPWREIPLPTWLLLGGVLVGLVVGFLAARFAAIGARRAARRVQRRLHDRVDAVLDAHVREPLQVVLAHAARARSLLDAMGG